MTGQFLSLLIRYKISLFRVVQTRKLLSIVEVVVAHMSHSRYSHQKGIRTYSCGMEQVRTRKVMKTITVHDRMQDGYTYTLIEPVGKHFHPDFKPDLTPQEMLALGVFGGKFWVGEISKIFKYFGGRKKHTKHTKHTMFIREKRLKVGLVCFNRLLSCLYSPGHLAC